MVTKFKKRSSPFSPSSSAKRGQKFFDALKTLAWVVPLTILIWVYAERDGETTEPRPVSIPISIRMDAPNRIARLVQPTDANLIADVMGPRASVDELATQLSNHASQTSLQINIDPRIEDGLHSFDAADQISGNAIFVNHGLSVKDCKPTVIQVEVDDMMEKLVAIIPPANLPTLEAAHFEPERVKVRAPSKVWKAMGDTKLTAEIGSVDGLSQGDHKLSGVGLKWGAGPMDDSVTITPPIVSATLTIRQADEKFTLDWSVPVAVLIPYSVENKWRVNYTPTISNVVISGPPKEITAVKNDPHLLKALLPVSDRDLPGKEYRVPARFQFDLPNNNLKVIDPDKYQISYTLTDPT